MKGVYVICCAGRFTACFETCWEAQHDQGAHREAPTKLEGEGKRGFNTYEADVFDT
jgi:hypothetical protein